MKNTPKIYTRTDHVDFFTIKYCLKEFGDAVKVEKRVYDYDGYYHPGLSYDTWTPPEKLIVWIKYG